MNNNTEKLLKITSTEPPKYGKRVKVTNWYESALADPKDNGHTRHVSKSHYRIFGISDDAEIPKKLPEESMQNIGKSCNRIVARSEINFTSYPMNDFRFEHADLKMLRLPRPEVLPQTSYRDFYKPPFAIVKKKDCCKEPPDPLFFRIPKNDFEMLPTSTNKFMDDHLTMISEGRKKINYFRQIRNASNIFF